VAIALPLNACEMAQRTQKIPMLLRRMSGLEARPAIGKGKWKKQADQMRRQMDEMMSVSRIRPTADKPVKRHSSCDLKEQSQWNAKTISIFDM
jgi:hypothetical protein